jgi:2-polyprenyl-6-methoxyphenol hydroxylase-like FAD-dependent oxidoreductase
VTLLGDAVNTMSPGRGEGANSAPRDAALLRAALLRAALVSAAEGRVPLAAVAASLERPFMARPAR